MRQFAFPIVATAVLGATVQASAADTAGGTWVGNMRQIDTASEQSYPMRLRIDGQAGTTIYQTLDCVGRLTWLGETRNDARVFQETVENGPKGSCIDGVVLVTLVSGKAVLGWYGTFGEQPSVASAVLDPAPT